LSPYPRSMVCLRDNDDSPFVPVQAISPFFGIV
jgi:hypothetical protein